MLNFKHIKNALHKENCEYLTEFLKLSTENGVAGFNDDQCSKSWHVYHHPVLEKVLEEFTPIMEKETGKKLFPTYSYARYYLNGEELLCHKDRPACEYSATITLGFGGDKVWPIFAADNGEETDAGIVGEDGEVFRIKNITKLELEVGDALIYKGGEVPHWREKFDGEWQAQVFFHYVDQEGEHADQKYDGRECLSHHTEYCAEQEQPQQQTQSIEETHYWYLENAISHNSCNQMIQKFEQQKLQKAEVGGENDGTVELDIRNVDKLDIPNYVGIGATLTGMGLQMNRFAWNFDVTHSNQSEYLMYDVDGMYKTHVDTSILPQSSEIRKITVLAFLNEDFEGGKFYIENGHERYYPPQSKGTVLAFPSFMNHGVEPVTKGVRRSIVTWLVGPWFK